MQQTTVSAIVETIVAAIHPERIYLFGSHQGRRHAG